MRSPRVPLYLTLAVLVGTSLYGALWARTINANRRLIAALHHKNDDEVVRALHNGASSNTFETGQQRVTASQELLAQVRSITHQPLRPELLTGVPVLCIAVKNNDPVAVQALLEQGAQVNARQANGKTALLLAVSHLEEAEAQNDKRAARRIIQLLLSAGADVNACDNMRQDALLLAAYAADAETVALLLQRGAAPTAGSRAWGGEALVLAAGWGDAQIVATLLDKGANINYQSYKGRTALMNTNDLETVEVLLKHGASLNIRDQRGDTALTYARQYVNEKVVARLQKAGAIK